MRKFSNDNTFVSLTGGLGNQLFQLAAGLYVSDNDQLTLEYKLGKPRLNAHNLPEVASFKLPRNITVRLESRTSFFASKAFGYELRQGIDVRFYERIVGFRFVSRFFAGLVISIYSKRILPLKVSSNVGFSLISKSDKGKLLIGYFQSYLWMNDRDVLTKMRQIELVEENSRVNYFSKLADVEKPLIVHIRLGDYKNENSFGVPSPEYYASAIQRLFHSDKYGKIWIFSDEPDLASEMFRSAIPNEVRWIHNEGESAAQTLEIMRHGKGYVIANSTFSWWAAFLSYTADPEVIAPDPWFRHLDNPKDLLPPNWHVVPGWLD